MSMSNLKSAFVLGAAIVGLTAGGALAAVTTDSELNVMAGPDDGSGIIGRLDSNITVAVGQMSGDWCQITAPTEGWVACANLQGLSRTNLSTGGGTTGYDYNTDPVLGPNGGLHTPYNGEFH